MGGAFNIFTLTAGVLVSFMAGFWIGRNLRWKTEESGEAAEKENVADGKWTEGDSGPKNTGRRNTAQRNAAQKSVGQRRGRRQESLLNQQMAMEAADLGEPQTLHRMAARDRKRKGTERVIPTGRAIGSPCGGDVSFFYEGNRRGAVIEPAQGLLYAPASGKIIRLYPMGNAFLLRTEFGVELLIKVGSKRDELLSMYYRPRIVQNEIVNKGKLLLEFDLEGLRTQDADTAVSVSVEAADDYRDILVTDQQSVRVGETVLWVKDRKSSD